MSSGNAVRVCSVLLVVVLLTAELVSAAPFNDYDNTISIPPSRVGTPPSFRPINGTSRCNISYETPFRSDSGIIGTNKNLRDLYELLIRNEAAAAAPASAYNHQMERKGGRSPSLRLRFGRRADPLWHADIPSDSTSN